MSQRANFILVIFLFMAVYIFSCQKKSDKSTQPPPLVDTNVILFSNPLIASVVGIVTDENNNPVVNAQVSGGGKNTVTSAQGVFKITDGNFNGDNAGVSIVKEGYFSIVKTFIVKSGETAYVEVKLSPKQSVGTVTETGGTINFAGNNVALIFPSNAFATPNGTAYNGTVTVKGTYINPDDEDFGLRMPGNLMGATAPSTINVLRTYGMVGVELYDANGQLLRLANGKKVTISVKIPTTKAGPMPDSLPMWFFSTAKAIWIREGNAAKSGDKYVAEVSHFTFWNYDWPDEQIRLEMRLINKNDSTPITYATVSLRDLTTQDIIMTSTGSSGFLSGYVFKNTTMKLIVRKCNQTILDTTIGPYMTNTNLGNLYFNIQTPITIQGYVINCNGQPVNRGSVSATINGLDYKVATLTDGKFSIQTISCITNPITTTITGIDSVTGTIIPPQTVTINPNTIKNLGILMACVAQPDQYISYQLDGVSHFYIRGVDSARCHQTFAFNRTQLNCYKPGVPAGTEGFLAFLTGPTSSAPTDTSSFMHIHPYNISSNPRTLHLMEFKENYSSYPSSQGVPGWVIGTFYSKFYDNNNVIHTVRSYFRVWRNNF